MIYFRGWRDGVEILEREGVELRFQERRYGVEIWGSFTGDRTVIWSKSFVQHRRQDVIFVLSSKPAHEKS